MFSYKILLKNLSRGVEGGILPGTACHLVEGGILPGTACHFRLLLSKINI